ncbi:MAG: substrate-binding domain-containing protein [Opitutaceae bacterium]|jgi:ribose transport system substrate-binding protein|nr:substrate-binding domain-containing protein [Opitutaceae bacterium]
MKTKRLLPRFRLLILAALCALRAASGATAEKLVIFSQCNNAEPYRAAQNQRMAELWAAVPGARLEIMDAQQDNARQIAQIETAILRRPALLIVAPNESAPLTRVMGRALRATIPVICLERDISQPFYTSYVRADNREIGRLAGEYIVELLKKKNGAPRGIIVELCGLKGVEAEINREGGAHDVWKNYPDIKVAANPVADWLQSRGKDRMTEVLSALPRIDIVYGHNDPMAMGAWLAAKDKGREKEMLFVGVDGLPGPGGGIEKVREGLLAATFVYPLCVDEAVEIGAKILADKTWSPPKTVTVKSRMVTQASLPPPTAEK